jgi:ATP-dependent RNA helicase HelY
VKSRRGPPAVDVVGEDARRRTLDLRDLRAAPVVIGRIDIPAIERSPRGFTRRVADLLRVAPRATALPVNAGPPRVASSAARVARQRAAIVQLHDRIAAATAELDDELDALVALLRRRGHLVGWEPTSSGVALARLFHDAGLLVAEALRASLFDGLSPAELAALASCFTPRGTLADHAVRAPTPGVAEAVRAADQLARSLNEAEDELGLPYTPSPNASLSGVVFRWSETGDLGQALRGSDVAAGDLVREVRQVAELVEQIALVSSPTLAGVCADALARLNRGVVIDELPGGHRQ